MIVLVKGLKKGFLGVALFCACHVGGRLFKNAEQDENVWKDDNDVFSCSL